MCTEDFGNKLLQPDVDGECNVMIDRFFLLKGFNRLVGSGYFEDLFAQFPFEYFVVILFNAAFTDNRDPFGNFVIFEIFFIGTGDIAYDMRSEFTVGIKTFGSRFDDDGTVFG